MDRNYKLLIEVRELKIYQRISYKKMASEMGISYDVFRRFTCGDRTLSPQNLDKVEKYLNNRKGE